MTDLLLVVAPKHLPKSDSLIGRETRERKEEINQSRFYKLIYWKTSLFRSLLSHFRRKIPESTKDIMISLEKSSCWFIRSCYIRACQSFWCNIEVDISFQKLPNFWMAKARMSTYILFKISDFRPALHKNPYIYRAQIPWDSRAFCPFNIFGNDANI